MTFRWRGSRATNAPSAAVQAQAGAAGTDGDGAGAAKEGDEKVVDAEYTEVKDRK